MQPYMNSFHSIKQEWALFVGRTAECYDMVELFTGQYIDCFGAVDGVR